MLGEFANALSDARAIEAAAWRMVAEALAPPRAPEPVQEPVAQPARCAHVDKMDVSTIDDDPGFVTWQCPDCEETWRDAR